MAEESLRREMPSSIEAEQAVIGAMMMYRDAISVASRIITKYDFYSKQYGFVF